MKRSILLTSISLLISQIVFGQKSITPLWTSDQKLPTPESVLFVPQQQELYVSLIDGDASEKDGKGGIAVLNIDGSLKNATWVTGLHAPKGLALHNNLLYIADIDEVVIVDNKSGKVVNRIAVPESTFLNDVAAAEDGTIFISDTRQNKIFQLKNNQPSFYLDQVPSVNGLRVIDGHLHALAGKELWKLDANKNKTVLATDFEQGGDGLEPVGNGDFLVTCWVGLIYYVKADGTTQKLLDVQGKMNTADLGYDPAKKILYIPTFGSNSVVAYQLK